MQYIFFRNEELSIHILQLFTTLFKNKKYAEKIITNLCDSSVEVFCTEIGLRLLKTKQETSLLFKVSVALKETYETLF